jgi:hypothetical protein
MTDSEVNETIQRADARLAKIGTVSAACTQRLYVALARLMKSHMSPQLEEFLDLADEHIKDGSRAEELRQAKRVLISAALEPDALARQYDTAAFARDLVQSALTCDAPLSYSPDAPLLSHAIWWLAASGVPLSEIEAVLQTHLFKQGGAC